MRVDFIKRIFLGEFNFILPVSYMIAGILIAIFIFTVRYVVYTKRKRAFAKQISSLNEKPIEENIPLVKDENGQAIQEKII